MKPALHLIVILALLSSSVFAEKIHDFDIACTIFTEAENTTFNNHETRNAYVEDNIDTRISSNTIKDTYYVVFNLPPEQRYDVFKKSAENELKRTWDCPAAKALLK